MLTAVGDAQSHVEKLDKSTFLANRLVQQAVSLNLIVIGELAGQICKDYPEFAANSAEIRWQDIRNMRNRLAHGYFAIDFEVVWDTVQNSVPALERFLSSCPELNGAD
jgi:uncharacterized protein with HEPN domain